MEHHIMQVRLIAILLLITIYLTGCTASGHKFYDSFKYSPPTSSCAVIWVHSYEAARYHIEHELKNADLLGKSTFSTSRYYTQKSAASDCKRAGGDYILVISEGYKGSSHGQFTVRSTQTLHGSSNTNYSGRYSYGNIYGNYSGFQSTNTSYQVPVYDTYDVSVDYYGYSYYVFKRIYHKHYRKRYP